MSWGIMAKARNGEAVLYDAGDGRGNETALTLVDGELLQPAVERARELALANPDLWFEIENEKGECFAQVEPA